MNKILEYLDKYFLGIALIVSGSLLLIFKEAGESLYVAYIFIISGILKLVTERKRVK
ncbi:hypothetical protein [Peribacillus butanolivorans]|uniref:hypothetical protein n=1 Tax=Peribacillus butanolivorans TaxID=421767 RepID=UPI0036DE1D57